MIERIKTWLNNRGITDEVIEKYQVGWNGYQVVIPVCDEKGNFLFNKYRRDPDVQTGEKYLYEKGSKATLYGLHLVNVIAPLVITEGELDTLALTSRGFQAVSSTGGSKTFKEDWVPLLSAFNVFICYDTDPAGRQGALRTHYMLPGSKVMNLSKGKDVTEYFLSGGTPEEFVKLMRGAMTYPKPKPQFERPEEYKVTGDSRIERAKCVPISNFIKFNQEGKAPCIWTNEKTPSMHYYRKTNKVWCFGCGKGGDVIDVYAELNHVTMKEALNALAS